MPVAGRENSILNDGSLQQYTPVAKVFNRRVYCSLFNEYKLHPYVYRPDEIVILKVGDGNKIPKGFVCVYIPRSAAAVFELFYTILHDRWHKSFVAIVVRMIIINNNS